MLLEHPPISNKTRGTVWYHLTNYPAISFTVTKTRPPICRQLLKGTRCPMGAGQEKKGHNTPVRRQRSRIQKQIKRETEVEILGRRCRGLLTCLAGANIDGGIMGCFWTQFRHQVDSLDLKGVLHTGQEVGDLHATFCQAHLARFELYAVPTAHARPRGPCRAHFADDIEENVLAAAQVLGEAPGQEHVGANDFIAKVTRSRGDA